MEGNEHAIIAVATFKNQAVNVRIPFEIPAKSMKNHDITGSEVFGFVHFKEHVENNTGNRMEKTMKQSSVLKENMTKKGKLRKGIGILLAVCMALPVGFVTKSETVHGKVIDADITKRELWSTSFESADGFKTSTVDDKKGTANIATNELSYQINGNLSGEIESYSG